MSTFKFKPGATFKRSGLLKLEGVSDFTGYTVQSSVRELDAKSRPLTGTALAVLDASIAANGLVVIEKDAASTASWPVYVTLAIDVLVITPAGDKLPFDTAYFETELLVSA